MQQHEGDHLRERIDGLLHDMCQPLTVLQCRLALGELNGRPEAMRVAIGEALNECARLNHAVEEMREALATVNEPAATSAVLEQEGD